MEVSREERRRTFDTVADLYQRARPGYPDELFDDLVRTTGITREDRLLEIGCATGTATVPLAMRGFRMVCLELGPDLAAVARRALKPFTDVTVVTADFETWQPPAGLRFDLVFAATAWQWIDPDTRYRQVWDLIRPGGHFAFWSATHVIPEAGDPFFADIQPVYEEIGAGVADGSVPLRPGDLPDDRAEIDGTGLFDVVHVRQFDWELAYTAEEYLQLLDTFSSHIALRPGQRDRLYGEIRRRLAQRADGRLRRRWGAVLQIARRRDAQALDGCAVI